MRYLYIAVVILTIIFAKSGVDAFKRAPTRYVPENYIGWYPPQSRVREIDSVRLSESTNIHQLPALLSPPKSKRGMYSFAKQRRWYRVSNPTAENAKVKAQIETLPRIFQALAYCESRTRHYNTKTGFVLSGREHPPDTGIFQLNLADVAIKKFLKAHTCNAFDPDDNIRCAGLLYFQDGLSPWKRSRLCVLRKMRSN